MVLCAGCENKMLLDRLPAHEQPQVYPIKKTGPGATLCTLQQLLLLLQQLQQSQPAQALTAAALQGRRAKGWWCAHGAIMLVLLNPNKRGLLYYSTAMPSQLRSEVAQRYTLQPQQQLMQQIPQLSAPPQAEWGGWVLCARCVWNTCQVLLDLLLICTYGATHAPTRVQGSSGTHPARCSSSCSWHTSARRRGGAVCMV